MAISTLVSGLLAGVLSLQEAPANTGGAFLPPAGFDEIVAAWNAGNLDEASEMAEAYLEYSVSHDGRLGREGAGLAFIVALSKAGYGYVTRETGHWLWVARQHEQACGDMPNPFHAVISENATRPGESRAADRRIASSPFRTAALQPCREDGAEPFLPHPPEAPWAERAVVIFSSSVEWAEYRVGSRIAGHDRVGMIYEFPANTLSPSLVGGRWITATARTGRMLPSGVVVLSPCSRTPYSRGIEDFWLCRADIPDAARQ